MVFRAAMLVAIAAPLFAQRGGIVEGRIASSATHAGIGEVRVTLRMVSEPKTVYNHH